jgi:hypothetical protein
VKPSRRISSNTAFSANSSLSFIVSQPKFQVFSLSGTVITVSCSVVGRLIKAD